MINGKQEQNKYSAKDIIICPYPHRHQLHDGSIFQLWHVKTKSIINKNVAPINTELTHKIRIEAFKNTQPSNFLSLDDFDISLLKIDSQELEILIRFKYGVYNEDFAYTKNVFIQVDKYISEITHIQGLKRKNWIWFRNHEYNR